MLAAELRKPRFARLYRQEVLIADAQECICRALQREGMTRSDLARVLKVNRSLITHFLTGKRNLTLRTLADVLGAMGWTARITLRAKR